MLGPGIKLPNKTRRERRLNQDWIYKVVFTILITSTLAYTDLPRLTMGLHPDKPM